MKSVHTCGTVATIRSGFSTRNIPIDMYWHIQDDENNPYSYKVPYHR